MLASGKTRGGDFNTWLIVDVVVGQMDIPLDCGRIIAGRPRRKAICCSHTSGRSSSTLGDWPAYERRERAVGLQWLSVRAKRFDECPYLLLGMSPSLFRTVSDEHAFNRTSL